LIAFKKHFLKFPLQYAGFFESVFEVSAHIMQIVLKCLESVFMVSSIVDMPRPKKALRTGFVAF
jgi:hypothetical protein